MSGYVRHDLLELTEQGEEGKGIGVSLQSSQVGPLYDDHEVLVQSGAKTKLINKRNVVEMAG